MDESPFADSRDQMIELCKDVPALKVLHDFSMLIHAFRRRWKDMRDWPATAKRLDLLCCRLREFVFAHVTVLPSTPVLQLLLDKEAFRATYVIDIFCQLEWLLRGLLDDAADPACTRLPDHLARQVTDFLKVIQPPLDTCRCMYATCTFSATARSKYLRSPTSYLRRPTFSLRGLPSKTKFFLFCDEQDFRKINLQVFLERVEKQPEFISYTWPLALMDMLDLMLEIASLMECLEEGNLSYGHLSPRTLVLVPWKSGERGHCVKLAPEIGEKSECISSDVYGYGSVCFNILTADDPAVLKSTQTIGSSSAFYAFVRSGTWKELVQGKPEYLVSLIAWCWETDPSKRPTFATICSLLQRAMRCLIFPPVLNLTRLSNFLQQSKYSLLNIYLSFTWSRDMRYSVIGTGLMDELLQAFASDTIELQHFSSDFMCDKVMQAFAQIRAWRRMTSNRSNVQATLALSQTIYEEEEDLDRKSSVTPSSPREVQLGSLIELGNEFVISFSDMAFNSATLKQHSIIFEALVYDCMVATFPSLDYQFWIRPLINMSHHHQNLHIPRPKSLYGGGEINYSLLPRLACFWEGQTCSERT